MESKLNAGSIKFCQLQGSAVNQEEFEEISNQNKELQGQLNSASQTIGGLQNQLEDLKAEIEEKDKKLKELEEPHAVMAPAAAQSPVRDGYGRSKTKGWLKMKMNQWQSQPVKKNLLYLQVEGVGLYVPTAALWK